MAGSFWLVVLGLITVDCLQTPEASRQVTTHLHQRRQSHTPTAPPRITPTGYSRRGGTLPNPNPQSISPPSPHPDIIQFFMLPVQIPAKYLPLLFYAIFMLFGGPRLDMACAIALGYAQGFGCVRVCVDVDLIDGWTDGWVDSHAPPSTAGWGDQTSHDIQ